VLVHCNSCLLCMLLWVFIYLCNSRFFSILFFSQDKHFRFIYCVEDLVNQRRVYEWESCYKKLHLDSEPIKQCYNSERGKQVGVFLWWSSCSCHWDSVNYGEVYPNRAFNVFKQPFSSLIVFNKHENFTNILVESWELENLKSYTNAANVTIFICSWSYIMQLKQMLWSLLTSMFHG